MWTVNHFIEPISKLEFEFERRLAKDNVRELVYREV